MKAFVPKSALGLFAIALSLCAAAQPDSTYLVNDSVYIRASPKNVTSSFSFDSVKFDVDYNYKNGGGGFIGGAGSYFRGRVTVRPYVTFDTASRYLDVRLDVRGEIYEKREPGGLAVFFYELAAQDVGYADQQITQLKIYLGDRDTVIETSGTRAGFRVPDDVTKLNGIEALYDGSEVKVRKRMFFGQTGNLGGGGGSALPWIIPTVIAIAAGGAYVAKKNSDKKKRSWIEIVLVDRENNPVANESCNITLSDGTTRSATTDRSGKVRLQGIPQGICRVSFPNIDGREWSASTGTPITEKIET